MKIKLIKTLFITVLFGVFSFTTMNQNTNNESEKEAVEIVLKSYRDAVQNLTVENTDKLFAVNSEIFESGGSEGNYQTYKEHHLGPELKYFKSFTFNNYKIDIKVDLPYAFATESYTYEIVIAANKEKGMKKRVIKKKGIATVLLKKTDSNWKILKYHSSSRGTKPSKH